MPIIDPWSGFNQGTQTLRQVTQDQMTNKIGKMKLQEAEQDQAFKAGLRELETLMDQDGVPEEQRMPLRQKYAMSRGRYDVGQEFGKISDLESKAQRRDAAATTSMLQLLNAKGGAQILKDPVTRAKIAAATGIPEAGLMQYANREYESPEDERLAKHQLKLEEIAARGQDALSRGLSLIAARDKGGGDRGVIDILAEKLVSGQITQKDLSRRKDYQEILAKAFQIDPELNLKATGIETTADAKSLEKQQATYDSMNSFVKNMNKQIDRVKPLAQDLMTFDAALLNMPLRSLRSKIAGSPLQSKYDMYLTSIESEIGKLATGSTGSVRELSVEAQKRWDKIHNKNLSVADMLEVLEETRNEADMRLTSQAETVQDVKDRLRGKVTPEPKKKEAAPGGNTKPEKTSPANDQTKAKIKGSAIFQRMKDGEKKELTVDGKKVRYGKLNGEVILFD